MTPRQELIVKNVDNVKQLILDAERWIWAHPEVGYTEWQTQGYLIERFEALGYTLTRADQDPNFGKIPGFYTDADTGRWSGRTGWPGWSGRRWQSGAESGAESEPKRSESGECDQPAAAAGSAADE